MSHLPLTLAWSEPRRVPPCPLCRGPGTAYDEVVELALALLDAALGKPTARLKW